jgi:hypothetical protein
VRVAWQPDTSPQQAAGDEAAAHDVHQRALERGDEVVQQLAVAKYSLSVGDLPRGLAAIDTALDMARRSLSDLLAMVNPHGPATYAGALVRDVAAQRRATD